MGLKNAGTLLAGLEESSAISEKYRLVGADL